MLRLESPTKQKKKPTTAYISLAETILYDRHYPRAKRPINQLPRGVKTYKHADAEHFISASPQKNSSWHPLVCDVYIFKGPPRVDVSHIGALSPTRCGEEAIVWYHYIFEVQFSGKTVQATGEERE